MSHEAVIQDAELREVIKDVEYGFKNVFDESDIITQNLKDGARIKNIITDDEVELSEQGNDIKLVMRLLTDDIGDELVEVLHLRGGEFSDTQMEVPVADDPEVERVEESVDEVVEPGGDIVDDYREGRREGRVNVGMEGEVGQVVKPFDHEDADYRTEGDDDFDPNHQRCRDCAHYDDNGNCHIVEDIEPDGYCSNFYADFGVFGHRHPGFIEINLSMVGDSFNWSIDDAESFIEKVADELRGIINNG